MYEDLLGPRPKKKEKVDIDFGICCQCIKSKRTGHGKSVHVYCEFIRKYVHQNQTSCLQFERREVDLIK